MNTEHLGKHISLLYRYSQIYFNTELKKYHLGSGQYIFLLSLLENEGINQEQLASLVKIDKTTTARAVAKLMREGYVRREISPDDHRAYILHSADKAHAVAENIRLIMDDWNDTMLDGFSTADKQKMHTLLKRAIKNVLKNE